MASCIQFSTHGALAHAQLLASLGEGEAGGVEHGCSLHLRVGELPNVRATSDAFALQMFEDSLPVDVEGPGEDADGVASFVAASEFSDPLLVEAKLSLEHWGSAGNDPDGRHGHREQAIHCW